MTTRRRLFRMAAVALALVAGAALTHAVLRACSSYSEPLYVHRVQPDHGGFEAFAKGELGLLQPTFARSYLVVAYRHLAGLGLDPEAQQGALRLWWERAGLGPQQKEGQQRSWDSGGEGVWTEARKLATAQPAPESVPSWNENYAAAVDVFPPGYAYAAETLKARLQSAGAQDPWIADWVAGQDLVFSTAKGRALPAEAPASAPLWLKQDRAYQRAAALYYLGRFAECAAAFHAVAADKASPHRALAAYLEARAWSREGSAEGYAKALQLSAALRQDKSMQEAAAKLQDHLGYLKDPAAYFKELAHRLEQPASGTGFHDALDNFTFAWDRIGGDGEGEAKGAPLPMTEDLPRWIRAFAGGEGAAEGYAAKPTLPWLVAALAWAKPGDKQAPQLMAEAEKVKANSPAYVTLQYHLARLQVESGKNEEAATRIEALLKREGLPLSCANALRLLQRRLAKDFGGFLKLLPMQQVGILDDSSGGGSTVPEDKALHLREEDLLALRTQAPEDLLVAQALAPGASPDLKLPRLAFEKALWLGRVDALKQLQPAIPEEKALVDLMSQAQGPDERLFVLGLREGRIRNKAGYPAVPKDAPPLPALSAEQRAKAAEEQAAIEALGDPVKYHCRNVLAYAQAHPDHADVPEALFQVIQLTRNAYDESGETSRLSKACFQLLHKAYPKDPWAAKAKYYY